MFTYVAGISLADYIRRRRMSQAAFELQRTNRKVLDIALSYGYSSPTSFHRAFEKVHGISPTSAKNIGSMLHAYSPIHFNVELTDGDALTYHIEEKKAFRMIGTRTTLGEDMVENQKNIPNF